MGGPVDESDESSLTGIWLKVAGVNIFSASLVSLTADAGMDNVLLSISFSRLAKCSVVFR